MVPSREIWGRIKRLRDATTPECVLIFQNADRYYFSGTLLGEFVFIDRGEASLYCRKGCERAEKETPLPLRTGSLRDLTSLDGTSIGIENDVLPVSHYLYLKKLFPHSTFKDISHQIRRIRSIKSSYEIGKIERAARIADTGMRHAVKTVKPGMREIDLAASVEATMRREGHQGLVRSRAFRQELFFGHILSGRNGAVPSFIDSPTGGRGLSTAMPQGAGYKKIRRNEPILVDYVGVYEGYIADESRVFVCGTLPHLLQDALDASIEIQNQLEKSISSGHVPQEIFFKAVQLARDYGFEANFLGMEEKIKFVGHGVGLELDELPVLAPEYDEPLRKNMVVASEPKFIFPSGVAGVEDTFLVEDKKARKLTRFP